MTTKYDNYEFVITRRNDIFKNRIYKIILNSCDDRPRKFSYPALLTRSLLLSNICLIDIYQMWEFVYTMEFPKEISFINQFNLLFHMESNNTSYYFS